MIELNQGDILEARAEALVNTVNCVGIMGRGIALQFRKAFPENFKVYEAACERKEVRPGKMFVFDTGLLTGPRYIINFPTKRHWKGKSRIEDIESGLQALVEEVRKRRIHSIAIPPLGAGLGGLSWGIVRPLIEKAFENVPDVKVLLFEPVGAPTAEQMVKVKKIPGMTRGRAVLVELMRQYLAAVLDPFVSLLEVHKLMYFMQEAGEHLSLTYEKGKYGPYSKTLRHLLNAVEGHLISGFGDAADEPERAIELMPEAPDKAGKFLAEHPTALERVARVSKLIYGFETAHGMELLSTVHWVAVHEGAESADEALRKTYAWSSRKRRFEEKQIRAAWDVLQEQGWLNPGQKGLL